jgi:Gly-Xaa carboxypeptidase
MVLIADRVVLEQVVKDKVTKHAIKLAKKHGLDVEIFGKKSSYSHKHALSGGSLQVVILNELPPAPITSATSDEWKVLAGTIRHVYSDKYPGSDVIVAPSIMTGNTDTRFHWNNSQNIIRFSPSTTAMKDSRIHTVDERLLFSEHIQAVW